MNPYTVTGQSIRKTARNLSSFGVKWFGGRGLGYAIFGPFQSYTFG